MIILQRYVLRTVATIYGIALLLFVIALQLVEAVTSLVQYIQLSVPLATILQLQLLFLPSSVHFALPIAMLFSASFSMGNFHSTRELFAVFGAGVGLVRFCMSLFAFSLLISVCSFFLEDNFVVGSRERYNTLRESILLINPTTTDQFVAIFGGDQNDVYYAEYFDRATQTLVWPTFIERDVRGVITRRISANSAAWDGENWVLENAHSYVWGGEGGGVERGR